MNEVTIMQGLGFITGNWWWMLPALFCLTFSACGVIHCFGGWGYSYVFREKVKDSYLDKVAKVMLGKEVRATLEGVYEVGTRSLWYIFVCRSRQHNYVVKEVLATFMGFVYPLALLCIGAGLHFTPTLMLYILASGYGLLYTLRLGVDATRKAKKVMVALDLHKEDKNAY